MFKVGDKVRVRENLGDYVGNYLGHYYIARDMLKYSGKVMTIKSVNSDNYIMQEDDEAWFWTDEMLEPMENEVEVPDYIDQYIKEHTSSEALQLYYTNQLNNLSVMKVQDWIYKNFEDFLKALVGDYKVTAKLYTVKMPHLETSDNEPQYLSKRGKALFASRWNIDLQQTFTEAEIPDEYKPYKEEV
ncbi:DUF1642 domain-containing protein [Lactobacillus acetotolerans]|uniref:DUF1642 domain-containing protein n=1 Tax=Lactobacillus acetotolerans TaxID=1600 RepID=UPI002FD9241F